MDLLALMAAIAIPLAMNTLPKWERLVQRGVFAITHIWYGVEVLPQEQSNCFEFGP